MSWTELPGGAVTNFPVAATISRDGELYVFITGTDQQIYFNHTTGEDWAGWTLFPGDGRTTHAVAATCDPQGNIFVLLTGKDEHIYASWQDGAEWTPWSALGDGGVTQMTTTVTANNDRLCAFHVGKNRTFCRFGGWVFMIVRGVVGRVGLG
ncbi:MAG: hypothetical protein ACRDQ5_20015 [Sciscionella sp.]